MPLPMLQPGCRAKVTELRGGRAFNARLASMGIMPGTELMLVRGGAAGPAVVEVAGSRFVLGWGMAHRIQVEPLA